MSKNIDFASVGGTDKGQSVAQIQSISLGTAVPHCSVSDMDQDFLDKLLLAQKCAGVKFRINSAFRSVQYEKSKGRSGRSAHCLGKAVDISATDSKCRYVIVTALLLSGFNRIGIGKSFIHVDDDLTRSHPVIFHYYD